MKKTIIKLGKVVAIQIIAFSIIVGGVAFATITFPTSTPAGQTPGGKFMEYFNNMVGTTDCPNGQSVVGFEAGTLKKVCKPFPVIGVCGGANSTSTTSYPTSNLCSLGTLSDVDKVGTDGTFNWSCNGTNGGASVSCSSNKLNPVNGSCNNSINGGCTAGTLSWTNNTNTCGTTATWSCNGTNGGTNATNCSRSNGACKGCEYVYMKKQHPNNGTLTDFFKKPTNSSYTYMYAISWKRHTYDEYKIGWCSPGMSQIEMANTILPGESSLYTNARAFEDSNYLIRNHCDRYASWNFYFKGKHYNNGKSDVACNFPPPLDECAATGMGC